MPLHEAAHTLMAPLLFMVLCRHSFGCCAIEGRIEVDPAIVLETHLDLVLRGLDVRPPPPAA
jgi:hypothetical protein